MKPVNCLAAYLAICAAVACLPLYAGDKLDVKAALARPVIDPALPLHEVRAYVESHVPPMPAVKNVVAWKMQADRMRRETLAKVVFRGSAAVAWARSKTGVEWQETIDGGPGYKIRKLRYEALPGLWVPALLYVPEKLSGLVPVGLAASGHFELGKANASTQVRCINMAKRGMLVLNVDWYGMGQLYMGGKFNHYRMNQLDLCGTSGLALHYLLLSRGLDVLLAQPNADASKVAMSGLSGGGWQTIFISSLDTRVTLANPVAGYSSMRTRVPYDLNLGDSEQAPVDLVTTADYAQLTAMMAPRPLLLTYNAREDCCFHADHTLQPLVDAAQPIFALYGKSNYLRTHINFSPGTHNYDRDNREAYYRMLGDFFFTGRTFDAMEIACDNEVKPYEQLKVAMPPANEDFNSLALKLAAPLPLDSVLPTTKRSAALWGERKRTMLREITRFTTETVQAVPETEEIVFADGTVRHWSLRVGGTWTVPAVELTRGKPVGQVLIVADNGRESIPVELVDAWLNRGYRVLALDPFYLGESKIALYDYLRALQVSCVGNRPLGVQATQIAAIAGWANQRNGIRPANALDIEPALRGVVQDALWVRSLSANIVAVGPRTSLAVLVASALAPKAIGDVELGGSLASLKQVLEDNLQVDQIPEYFCFGLLEKFDIVPLAALSAPRRVTFTDPSDRLKAAAAKLAAWYKLYGIDYQPTKNSIVMPVPPAEHD